MDAIKEIVAQHGYNGVDDMDVGDHIKVNRDNMMPLTVEKIGEDRVSVAHYYTQRGDLMSDPEIVFKITDTGWIPVRLTQHPSIHQHNEDGLPKVKDFVRQWDRNLRKQGYVEEAQAGRVEA